MFKPYPSPSDLQNETCKSPVWKFAPLGRLNAPEREGPGFLSAVYKSIHEHQKNQADKVLSYLNLAPLPFETQNETRQSPIWKIAPVGRLNAPEQEGPLFLSAMYKSIHEHQKDRADEVLSCFNLAPCPFETQNETCKPPVWKIAPVGRLNAPERESPLFLSAVYKSIHEHQKTKPIKCLAI